MFKRRSITRPTIRRFLHAREATTAIEYALIASGISIVILVSVSTIGATLRTNYYDKLLAMF